MPDEKTTALDVSPAARQRRAEALEARMAGSSLTGEARGKQRRQIETEIEQAEIAEAQVIAYRAEASVERARIAAVIGVGRDLGRTRQAARLALFGPVSPQQAKAILPGLPTDANDTDAAIPGFQPVGGEAAAVASERRRIGAILAHPASVGRFAAAVALAVEGESPIPVDAAAALLAALPMEQTMPKRPSLEERAAGRVEFGGQPVSGGRRDTSTEMWTRAVSAANRDLGTGAVDPRTGRPSGVPGQ